MHSYRPAWRSVQREHTGGTAPVCVSSPSSTQSPGSPAAAAGPGWLTKTDQHKDDDNNNNNNNEGYDDDIIILDITTISILMV